VIALLVIPARLLGTAFTDRRFYISATIGPLVMLTLGFAVGLTRKRKTRWWRLRPR
jgi:hypothetical protein